MRKVVTIRESADEQDALELAYRCENSGTSFVVVCVVFVFALAARSAWGIYRIASAGDPTLLEFPDEIQYWDMARSLWSGEGLRDELGFRATRMPLFPGLLAPLTAFEYGTVIAKCVQWFVGAIGAVFAYLLGLKLFDRRVALLAGMFVAFDPFLVFFSSLLLTETLFVTVSLLLWLCALQLLPWISTLHDTAEPPQSALGKGGGRPSNAGQRRGDLANLQEVCPSSLRRWVLLGIVSALIVYVRESSLGLVLLLVVFSVFVVGVSLRSLVAGCVAVAVVLMALLPWAWRNQIVTGDFCLLTHRGGISLYDGVHPGATGASDLGEIKSMEAVQGLDEVAWNEYFIRESKKSILRDPMRIARLAGVKLARLWNPVPNVETYRSRFVRIVAAGWMAPTFALAIIGVVLLITRFGLKGGYLTLFLLLPAIYLSALHSLFVGSVRYRLGAMPMIELLAAFAIVALLRRDRPDQRQA